MQTRQTALETLIGFVNGAATSQAMAVAAERRVCDVLAAGPMDAASIARVAGCHAQSLRRLLRALASAGLFHEHEDGSFALTAMGDLLRADAPDSVRNWAINWGRFLWPEWGHLLHCVRTGESARRLIRRTDGLDHLDRDAEVAATFNRAMTEMTRRLTAGIARSYDFSGMRRIVDVGGGHGELIGAVLSACPALQGVLFDRSHALAGACEHLQRAGVDARCATLAGDFFESVPEGADGYLLKSVIHDWDDERGLRILRNCRSAIADGGRLLLIEQVMPERIEPSPSLHELTRRDLTMLVGPGGRERTLAEFRALLDSGGFRLESVIPVPPGFFALEAVPV